MQGIRAFAREALEHFVPADRKDDSAVGSFLERLFYQRLDASKTDGFAALAESWATSRAASPSSCRPRPRCSARRSRGSNGRGWPATMSASGSKSRWASTSPPAASINDIVAEAFPEERTFRIDHYLGKETVQNILALRFGNSLFEPVWNAQGIDHVQITVSETVGLEGRAGFYDETGALRDMVQNHTLQLLALIAMEPPPASTALRSATRR